MKKTLNQSLFCSLFCLLAALIFTPASRAGLSIEINTYRTGQGQTYVFYTPLTTNAIAPAAAIGTYVIMSPGWPTNGSRRGLEMTTTNGLIDRTEFDSENSYGDFNSAMQQITNGFWKILFTNTVTTNLYKFTVAAPTITSNILPAATISFPIDGEVITTHQTNFSFQGPSNWLSQGYGEIYNQPFTFVQVSYFAASATNWFSPVPPPENSSYTFLVNFITNYVASPYVVSTPLSTNNSSPISGWSSTAVFSTGSSVNFSVIKPGLPSSGHTNLLYYTFEDNNIFTHDYSENGNNVSSAGAYSSGPYITNTAKVGLYALGFPGDGFILPPTNTLLPALAQSFSVSLWFRSTQVHGSDNDDQYSAGGIFSALTGDYSQAVMPMGFTGHKLAFYTGGSTPNIIHSQSNINTGQYVHLVSTRDQQTGEKKIYINGVLDTSAYGTTDQLNGPNSIYLGFNNGSTINGSVDEVQLYSGVLSQSEISYLYNNPGNVVTNTVAVSPYNIALNTTNLTWDASSGDTSWLIESTNTQDGDFAMQSGIVTNNQVSILSTTVTGPGTLSFYWSSFAEDFNGGFDYIFTLDGLFQSELTGDNSWSQMGPISIPAGQHTLTWSVYGNGDTDPTEAGYLDLVNYTPFSLLPPTITLNPFSQTNYPGYKVALLAGATTNSPLTWQWYKVGSASPIPDGTNALYIPTNSGTAGVAGSYYAIASNAGGSATTLTAAVSFVNAPLPPDWSRAFKSAFTAVDSSTIRKDYYYGCFVDASSNIFVAAQFEGNTTVAATNLNSGTGGSGAAIIKHGPTGTAVWGAAITNNGLGSAYAECVAPAPNGGAYLLGNNSGTNWLGTNKVSDAGGGDMFIARFDTNGNSVWVKTFGGTNTDFTIINSLASDAAGNVTFCGLLSGGPVAIGTSNYNVNGQQGVLVQLDSTGAVRWSQLLPAEFPQYLTYNAGRLYVSFNTQTSGGTTNMVIGGLSNLTDRAWALACLNTTNGQPFWVRGVGAVFGGTQNNPYSTGSIDDVPRITVSGTNVFLTAAAYGSNAAFGGITVSFNSLRGQYFARYDTNGNPQLATTFGSTTTTPVASVADSYGNVYVSGNFDEYSIFGKDIIAAPLTVDPYVGGFGQAFLAKFDRNGNPLWVREAYSPAVVNLLGLALAPDGVWTSGWCLSSNVPPTFTYFGTNSFYSTQLILVGPPGGGTTIIPFQAGLLAKITEIPLSVVLLNPTNTGTNFKFSFITQTGFSHSIIYRTNLALGNWQTNSTVAGNGGLTNITLPLSIFNGSKQGYVKVSTQ